MESNTPLIQLRKTISTTALEPNTGRFYRKERASILLIVLPYLVKNNEAKKGKTKSFLAFPYGVLTMATYIQRHAKHEPEVHILDLNLCSADEVLSEVEKALQAYDPNLVGLSMMFDNSYKHVEPITQRIKSFNQDILILMGGAAVTTAWDAILDRIQHIDALCYSEGETALCALLDSDNPIEALGHDPWVTRKSIASGRTPSAQYVASLDEVVDINYELVDMARYSMKEAFSPFASYRNEENVRQFFLVTSRGCPFKCVFCAEPALHGGNMRYADVSAIIQHVEHMVHKHGMNVLTIYDDQILLNVKRAKELFRRLAPFKLRIEMPNGVTAVFIDDEMAALMSRAGVDTIPLALESGSDHVLRNVINKPLRLSRVLPVVEALHNNHIFVQAFFVTGLPGEREVDREETLQFIKDVGLDWSGFSLATPIRGSELFRLCKEKGYIDPDINVFDIEVGKYIIRAPDLDPEYITRRNYEMNLDVNFVNNRRMKIGDYSTAIRCFEEVTERYENHAFAFYYLVKAYKLLGASPDKYEHYRHACAEIFGHDREWQRYAERFGLDWNSVCVEEPCVTFQGGSQNAMAIPAEQRRAA